MTETTTVAPVGEGLAPEEIVSLIQSPSGIDKLVIRGSQLPQIPTKLVNRFAPGMYIRELTMPAGSIVVSRIHKTTHPFVITKGRCSVFYEGGSVVNYEAPFTGITQAGTRRLLFIQDETTWTTFHATDITDPEEWVDKHTSLLSDESLPGAAELLAKVKSKEIACP